MVSDPWSIDHLQIAMEAIEQNGKFQNSSLASSQQTGMKHEPISICMK